MSKYLILSVVVLLLFSACRPDEEALEPRLVETISLTDDFANRINTVSIDENYDTQVFFDLQTNSAVASLSRYDWDFALSNSEAGRLYLNSAVIGLRAAVSQDAWENTTDPALLDFAYDLPDWSALALDDVLGSTLVFDRGLLNTGESRGFLKCRIETTGDLYTLTVANLDGSDEEVHTIIPDAMRDREWCSLETGQLNSIPAADEWDLLFTSYLHVFDPESAPNPYQVTGALLNAGNTLAAESNAYAYDEYTLSTLSALNLRADRDLIGYDWKFFDFDLGFVIEPGMVFTVRSTEGDYYALRFTSFYDENGVKGHMGFNYRLLGDE
jgi:hypothetical protein